MLKWLFLFLSSSILWAHVLEGTLLERGTKRKLSNVNIYLIAKDQSQPPWKVISDEQAQFEFTDIPDGTYELVINYSGYQKLTQSFQLTENRREVFYLEKIFYNALSATVVAKKNKPDASLKRLTQEEFLQVPGSGGDPVRAIENLPGVAQSLDANVAIQGSPPEDTLYTILGHEVPFMFHFFGLNTVMMPEAVESVDFYSAGFDSQWGRSVGGVVNLTPRKPRDDRWYGMGFVDFLSSGGYLEGPVTSNSSMLLSARYSYVGQVLKFVTEQTRDDEEDPPPTFNSAPTFVDVSLYYDHSLSHGQNISFFAMGSRDAVDVLIEDFDEPTFAGGVGGTTEFFRLIAQYENKISDDQAFDLSVGWGLDSQRFTPGVSNLKVDNNTTTVRSQYRGRVNNIHSWSLGLDYQRSLYQFDGNISSGFFTDIDVDFPQSVANNLIADVSGTTENSGFYLNNEIRIFRERLSLNPNLRIDHFSQHQNTYLQPRPKISYTVNDSQNISLQGGLFYQPLPFITTDSIVGNSELRALKSTHIALRTEKDFRQGQTQGLTLSGGVFYKELQNAPLGNLGDISNELTGDIYGAEMLAKYRFQEWSLNLGYTYTRSEREDPINGRFRSPQDQTHNLNFSGVYTLPRWTFSSRFRYVTGRPFTPVQGGVYFENQDVFIPIQGDRLSQRLGNFWQLDIRIDRKWIFDTWILSAYIDIQNLTNRKNEFNKAYSYDFSQEQSATGLPILPTFGVRGEF